MQVMTYADARANLKDVMDRVVDDCEEVIVTRKNGKPVVILSLDEWNAIQETFYLRSTPRNANALHQSIAQLDGGGGTERALSEA